MINELISTLHEIRKAAGFEFSGIGIIICNTPDNLPIFPIRLEKPSFSGHNLVSKLTEVSSLKSNFHDGFHVISSEMKIQKIAQYFSPPIVFNVTIDRTKNFGGRYLAALFGSVLPHVTATGIASNGFGIAVFQNGKEIYSHKA